MAAKVGVAYIDVKPNFDGFERAVKSQTDGIVGKMGGAFAGAGKAAAAAFAGVGAIAVAGGGIGLKIASDMQQAQIAFTTMLGSADAAKAHLETLKQFAAATPFELPGLVQASEKLVAFGWTAQDSVKTLKATGDVAAGMNLGQEGIDRITTALGQMKAKGKVSGEELMQLNEAGINGFELLASATGKPVPELQKMVSEGKVSADVFINAFNNMQGPLAKFNGLMDAQSRTIAGMWSTLKDTFNQGLATMAQPLADQLTAVFPQVLQSVQSIMTAVGPILGQLGGQIASVLTSLMPVVQPLIEGLATLLVTILTPIIPVIGDIATQIGATIQAIMPALIPLAKAIGDLVAAFGPVITKIIAALTPVMEPLIGVFTILVEVITKIVQAAAPFVDIIVTLGASLLQALLVPLGELLQALVPLLDPIIQIAQIMADAWIPVIQALTPLFTEFVRIAMTPLMALLQALTPLFQWLAETMQAHQPEIMAFTQVLTQGIAQGIQLIDGFNRALGEIGSVISTVFNTVGQILSQVWNGTIKPIWDAIGVAIEGLKASFRTIGDVWSSVWGGTRDVVMGVWNTILDVINGAVNGVISIINGILDGINSVMEPLPGDWTPLHIEPVSIAGRAKGGPVTAGTPYMVGEKGPELFVPGRSGTIVPNGPAGPGVDGAAVLEPVLGELVAVLAALVSSMTAAPAAGMAAMSPVVGGDGAAAPVGDPAAMAAAAGATTITAEAMGGLAGSTAVGAAAVAGFDQQLGLSTAETLPLATAAVQTQDWATQMLSQSTLGNVPVQAWWQQTLATSTAFLNATTAAVQALIGQLQVLNATVIAIHVDRSQVDSASTSIAGLAQTVVASMAKLGLDNNVLAQWLGVVLALPAGVIAGAVKAESGGLVGRDSVGGGFATSRPTLVGEGSRTHREWVIPTDPKWRSNSLALLAGLHSDLGVPLAMESGGIVGQTAFDGTAAGSAGLLFKLLSGSLIAAAATAVGRSGSVTGDDWQAITHYLDQVGVPYQAISTVRPGARTHASGALSYHATGDAVDLAGNLMEIWQALDKLGSVADGGPLQELIYSMAPTYIGGGTRKGIGQLNAITKGDHYDHVHAAIPRDATYAGAGGTGGGIDIGPWTEVGRYIVDHFAAAGIGAPAGAAGYGGDIPVSSGVAGQWVGRISTFGGPNDPGARGGMAYDGTTVDAFYKRIPYAAMRLSVGTFQGRRGEIPLPPRSWISIAKGGARTNAQILDWGPGWRTNRLVDVAPYVADAIGANTDDTVTVSALAEGGYTVQPGMAYVHGNEAHLPLGDSRTIDALAAALDQAGAGGGGGVDQRQYHFHQVIPTAADIADEMYWREFVEAR